MFTKSHLIVLISCIACGFGYAQNAANVFIPITLKQNAFAYTSGNMHQPLISIKIWESKIAYFKQQYFQPWNKKNKNTVFCYVPGVNKTCKPVKIIEQQTLAYYHNKVGYNKFYLKHNKTWLTPIKANMNMASFPNISCTKGACRAIIVKNAEVRSLPTSNAFYQSFTKAGQGYPFDSLQLSDLWLGMPVQILQVSKDKKWILVKGQGVMGWIPTNTVAKMHSNTINVWKSSLFIIPTVRNQLVKLSKNKLVDLRIGSLLPRADHHQIAVPVKQADGYATLVTSKPNGLAVTNWPLKPNKLNFARQINMLLGMPYGWGGMDFHSDCSSLMRRLFLSFGIWLPRNSYSQANYAGVKHSLATDNTAKRKSIVSNKAVPFLTLVSYGGTTNTTYHISLFIGFTKYDHHKVALIFQAPWGAPITGSGGITGRAIIGQSVITPIGMGRFINQALVNQKLKLLSLWNTTGFNLTFLNTQTNS